MALLLPELPIAATLLGGFVLAHAVWSVSDLPPSELLVPLAIVEQGGHRTLHRFEADTQIVAVENGKRVMSQATKTADAWAFAREGAERIPPDNPIAADVIVLDFWAKGMSKPASAIQRFERGSAKRGFRLLGNPVIVVDGKVVIGPTDQPWIDAFLRGVASHAKVATLWTGWLTK